MPYKPYESDGLNAEAMITESGNDPQVTAQSPIQTNIVKGLWNIRNLYQRGYDFLLGYIQGVYVALNHLSANFDQLLFDLQNDYNFEGGITVGAAPDQTDIDDHGHITFTGTAKVWDDIRVEPVARTVAATTPAFEKWYDDQAGTSKGVYLYSFSYTAVEASQEELFFNLQMDHSWDGGPIHMHVHWAAEVSQQDCAPRWGLEYVWKNIGGIFGDTDTIYTDGVNYVDGGSESNITAGTHYVSMFTALTPDASQQDYSSILICRLFRHSSNAADTYTNGKCGLMYSDAHYQKARIGSDNEFD